MLDPAHQAVKVINDVLLAGSTKEGNRSVWRSRSRMYHLTKAIGHLATHIKHEVCGTNDGENHLHLAITRLAMALCV